MIALAAVLFIGYLLMLPRWEATLTEPVRSAPESRPVPDSRAAPVPFDAIRPPAGPRQGQRLGIATGVFVSRFAAEESAERARGQGYPVRVLNLGDRDGQHWFMVVVGEFETEAEAERLRQLLGSVDEPSAALDLVLLPSRPRD